MYIEYPDQEAAYTHDQQYMFGKEFLVAPITTPGQLRPRKSGFPQASGMTTSPATSTMAGGRLLFMPH